MKKMKHKKAKSPRTKKQIVLNILLVIFAAVFLISGGILAWELWIQPAMVSGENNEIADLYHQKDSNSSQDPERDANGNLLRFQDLLAVNSEIVGWINIPSIDVDLPVLQSGKDNRDFYLTHNYKKEESKAGAIYLDADCSIEGSRSMILYGHSLNNGLMFTQLNKYKDLDFYKTAPTFTFDTLKEEAEWKIISVFVTNVNESHGTPFNYLKSDFKDDSDFLNFVYQLRIRSLYDTGVSFNADDQIVLLSTCSYEFDNFREVVVARKVREGEDPSVDTSAAKNNPKTLYPDIWYRQYGGAKPSWPDTYEEAKEQNLLTWSES